MSKTVAKVIPISPLRTACKDCYLRERCLPADLDADGLAALGRIVKSQGPLRKGESLFRRGDRLTSLYVVRVGTLKTTNPMKDGRAQIVGFYLPGEFLGLDGIVGGQYSCGAEALETSLVCEIPFQALIDLTQELPGLQRQLFRIMSGQIGSAEKALTMLGTMNAEERLAACLMSLSQRRARHGADARQFALAMSRAELGDYLGLALETVSRLFARLRDAGLIEFEGRHIVLRDAVGLQTLSVRADSIRKENVSR